MTHSARPQVLLVEDNPDDVLLLRRAFAQATGGVSLAVAADGDAAVRFLQRDGEGLRLLVLDLKLPRRSGFEVLGWLRANAALALLPVVVLTSSGEDSDIRRAYELGANSYLVKPVDFSHFQEMARSLERYWLQLNAVAVSL